MNSICPMNFFHTTDMTDTTDTTIWKPGFTWLNSVVESTEFCSYRNAAHLRFLCQLSRTLHDELDENMIV